MLIHYTHFMKHHWSSWAVFFPMLVLYIFVIGALFLRAAVRVFLFSRSFWYVSGFGGACYSPYWCCVFCIYCKNRALLNTQFRASYEQSLVQLGRVFPQTSAAYYHYRCAIFECDGPNLLFCCAFWYVFGLGEACGYSPCWC